LEHTASKKPCHILPEQYLQAVIDGLEDELLVIDRDYRLVQVNEAVLERHGKTRAHVIGKYCYDVSRGLPELCHPPRHECPITRVWETGQTSRATHLHLYGENGESKRRYVDVIASPLFDAEGKVAYVVELIRDVTESKVLEEQSQAQDRARRELLSQLFSCQEDERKKLARELHDETTQSLTAMAVNLEALAESARDEAARSRLKSMQADAVKTLDGLHRLIYELRPIALDDFGLVSAVNSLARRELERGGIAVEFRVHGKEKRLPADVENGVYRVVQEAISNIVRHSRAGHCEIDLHFKRGSLAVRVRDDGAGFDVTEALTTTDRPRGLGLLGMRERVDLLKGKLEIVSGRDRKGTEVSIEVPTGGGNE